MSIAPLPKLMTFNPDNSILISAYGLFDKGTKTYLDNTATVSAELIDSVGNIKQTITLTYVANSNGDFQGIMAPMSEDVSTGWKLTISGSQGAAEFSITEDAVVESRGK